MKLTRPRENDNLSGKEKEVVEAMLLSVDAWTESNIRFGPLGLYLEYEGKIFLFDCEIKYIREVAVEEDQPEFRKIDMSDYLPRK